ncbi:MAG: LPS export ABC transporter periplasmic protein LptC [Alphaproteobacteria bacterium]
MASADTPSNDAPQRGSRIPVYAGQRRFSRSYGRFVGWMKVLLPTIAVMLIALLIIWPYLRDEGNRITEALTSAGGLISEHLEVNQARYAGLSEDGHRYTVTAESVQQDSIDAINVAFQSPQADISLSDGSWALVTAERGSLDRETQVLELIASVNLFHDLGYEFRTESATFDLLGGSAYGFDPVTGQGPFGYVEAMGFSIFNRGERIELIGPARVVIYDTD